MARNDVKYVEIAKAEIADSRNVVVSKCSVGGFTIAQQLVAREQPGKDTSVYLKGAFHVDCIDGLYNLRDALNAAIHSLESGSDSAETWDDV